MKTFGFQEPVPRKAPLPAPAWREPVVPPVADAPPTPTPTPSIDADAAPTLRPIAKVSPFVAPPAPQPARALPRCSVCDVAFAPTETGYTHPVTGKWCCSTGCLRSANAQPNSMCLDGGNPADRARLAPAAPPPPKDREIRCPGCGDAVHFVPHDLSDEAVERLLDAHGWTAGDPRLCSSTCAMNCGAVATAVPRAPSTDCNVLMAHAGARRRQGLPELPEHRGLLPPSRTQ